MFVALFRGAINIAIGHIFNLFLAGACVDHASVKWTVQPL